MISEAPAWTVRGPNCIGYIRIYFKTRNARNPLYRRANRALCRYWIRQERLRRNAATH